MTKIRYAQRKKFKAMVDRHADIRRRWPQIVVALMHAVQTGNFPAAVTLINDVQFALEWEELGRAIEAGYEKLLLEGVTQ